MRNPRADPYANQSNSLAEKPCQQDQLKIGGQMAPERIWHTRLTQLLPSPNYQAIALADRSQGRKTATAKVESLNKRDVTIYALGTFQVVDSESNLGTTLAELGANHRGDGIIAIVQASIGS